MTFGTPRFLLPLLLLLAFIPACTREQVPQPPQKPAIVVTYAVLGAAVQELVGDAFQVRVLVPNGRDIHGWEPSAKDIEALSKARLIVQNGLGLERGVAKAIEAAQAAGVKVFTAADHVEVRTLGEADAHDEEGHHEEDGHGHEVGAPDPHLWTDPVAIKRAMDALAAQIRRDFGVDLTARAADLGHRLEALEKEIRQKVEALPSGRRKLITGHESLGYFADRYGFTLIGAVVPGATTESESSAADMETLKRRIREHGVSAVFTETGTPARTVEALAREAKVKVVLLSTHTVPADGSYFTFERTLANEIVQGLK